MRGIRMLASNEIRNVIAEKYFSRARYATSAEIPAPIKEKRELEISTMQDSLLVARDSHESRRYPFYFYSTVTSIFLFIS